MEFNKAVEHILIDKINDDTKVVLIIEENESVDIVMQNIDNYKELDEIMCEAFNRYIGDKDENL